MAYKGPFPIFMLLIVLLVFCESSSAALIVHSQTQVDIELIGYNGLAHRSLFKGSISARNRQEISTQYRGLALFIFKEGQRYPVIIGDEQFTMKITGPAKPPSFADSGENEFFYKMLAGNDLASGQYGFALLMVEAKQLLESSQSIHTIKDLKTKTNEFHEFVRLHYDNLKHSDMVRRLITQYFMMHEYIDYHIDDAPATDIRVQYQKVILNGVNNWLKILKSHIPEHEILNYCVSLYYNRSMVTLASLIIDNFRDVAYCPGSENKSFNFPKDLLITDADGNSKRQFSEFNSNELIAFVSDDCPVSMVQTIKKIRQLADKKKDAVVIVAPLQKLSEKHLIMHRMISRGKILFINDERWIKENLSQKIKLPLFMQTGTYLE